MRFEHVTSWECRVTKVAEVLGTFNYVILDADPDCGIYVGGTMQLANVPAAQRSLVKEGALFLCVIGMVCSTTNTVPASLLYFVDEDLLDPRQPSATCPAE
jgi:hypothetical protein